MPRQIPLMNRADYLQMHRERRELILAAVRTGKVYREVAKMFGISNARVTQIAQGAGIVRKPRKPR